MTGGAESLSYAARPRVVAKYLGEAGLILAALQIPPFVAAAVESDAAVAAAEVSVGLGIAAVCIPLRRLRAPEAILPVEALAVAALAFLLAGLLLWVPFVVAGLPIVDALFEAVSAVTTTGLTTLPSVEELPASALFLRSWAQWYGGLGFLVFAVALLVRQPAMIRRLVAGEAADQLHMATRRHARVVALTYTGLTVLGVLLLLGAGARPLVALVHALSAVSTGGFSTSDASVAGIGGGMLVSSIALLSFCGAISLPLYSELGRRRLEKFFADEELVTLVSALMIVWLLLAWTLAPVSASLSAALRDSALLAVFAQTTTGYAPLDVAALPAAAKLALIPSMAVGGSLGSTAGGVKILRLLLFVRFVQLLVRRLRAPAHAVVDLRLGGRGYDDADVSRALAYVLLFVVVCLLSWLVFVAAGYAPLDSLFDIVSATGTVGLSTGVTRPELEPALKLVLMFDMLAGRLEIIALIVMLDPRSWIGRRLGNQ